MQGCFGSWARALGPLAVLWLAVSPAAAGPRVAVLSGFEGLTNDDNRALLGSRFLPPDPMLGVGPGHVFQVVNLIGRVSDRAGTPLQTFTLGSFFGVDPGFDETDPRILYDPASGRWFGAYVQFSEARSLSAIILAVSAGSDPTGAFCRYRLGNPATEAFFQDFPMLGVSDDKVVVAFNGFTFGGSFLGGGYYAVSKADLLACASAPATFRRAPTAGRFTPHPAQGGGTAAAYLAVQGSPTAARLTILELAGLPPAVVESEFAVSVRPWLDPPPAAQPGSSVPLDTGDSRVVDARCQGQSLWVAGNERCTPAGDTAARSCLRLVEVRTDTRTVAQDITLGESGRHLYFPAIALDGASNLHVVFTASSAGEFASVAVSGRVATDPAGTLRPPTVIRAGGGPQTDASRRMGDYSGAAADPLDPGAVWVTGEYVREAGSEPDGARWGTFVARLSFLPLVASVLPASRSVAVGEAATAFVSVINAGAAIASGVGVAAATALPVTLSYRLTDPLTNLPAGPPDTPVDIPPGEVRTFAIALTPGAPFAPADVALAFPGGDTAAVAVLPGVNTLLLGAAVSPVADVVALVATVGNDGIVAVAGPGASAAFAVATVNLGAAAHVVATADTGSGTPAVQLALCRTEPETGRCLAPPGSAVELFMDTGATATLGVFVTAIAPVPFDPARNRVFVRFRDAASAVRGLTSVAVRAP